MKGVRKSIKTVWSLLLAMILCFQGLLPATDFWQADDSAHTGLTYAIAEEASDTPAASSGTNDLDGSKIEGIKVVWITPDSQTNNNGQAVSQEELDDYSHLYLATTSASPLSMIYKIEVEFSGQYDYAPGDITITIPAQVWHSRQFTPTGAEGETVGVTDPNKLIGSLELPLPAAPSKKADFNWQIIGDNYVLTNTRTIGATSSVSIEVAITDIKPMNVVDMSRSDPITAHCEVLTNQGNTIELTSLPIDAQIDTRAKITSAYKGGDVYETAPAELSKELLANLPAGTDPEDYVYVRWYTYHSHVNNQPFSLDIQDVLSDAYEYVVGSDGKKTPSFVTEGIFLGSTNYQGTILKDGDLDFTAEIADHIGISSTGIQYSHTAYMWSAYRKDKFYVPRANEPQRVYYFENEVEWILTETDASVKADQWNKPADPQEVTTAVDNVIVPYSPIRYRRPTGHFAVNKWTEQVTHKDWLYGYALNKLENKQPVDMNFVVETIGYGYPWTSPRTFGVGDPGSADNALLNQMELTDADFGLLGWKQITHDFQTFFNYETTPLTSEDFEMKGLRISVPSKMRYAKNSNGTWNYKTDSSLPTPDLLIEYQLNNEETWHTAAIATWGEDGTGTFAFKNLSADCTASGMTVYFPKNVTDVRHTFVSNVFNGKTAEKCDIAMIDWYVYPIITMKPSDRTRQIVKDLFEQNENPTTKFKNDVIMDVYGWVDQNGEGKLVLDDDFDSSLATYAGASYGVSLSKSGTYESDYENQRLLIHYTATLTEQSNLKNRSEYDAAVEEGVIPAETSGVWYDLLPPHVVPLLDTIKLRDEDTITNVYTIDNYNDTGRILLVVEAELTPKPSYTNGLGYADQPRLSFTAAYTWLDMDEYGKNLVNYVAFESTVDNLRNGTLGTIKNQKGDPDNPLGGNNATTPSMPADIASAMTGLNPNTKPGENRFVYGKCSNNVTSLTYAVSGLDKAVSNDFVGIWTQGLDGQEQVTVYEGLGYSYRLRVSSAETTSTKGIIIYDTIENYIIPDPSADEDTDATKAADFAHTQERKDWSGVWKGKGQWRGTLQKVDLSEFVNAGVAPVLLYSQLPGLQFADSKSGSTDDNFDTDTELFASGNYDITNRQIWKVAELDAKGIWTVPAGLTVSAIAIDATTCADGTEFILKPEESISGYLRMVAPDDNGNPDVWVAKGAYARTENGDVDWEAAMDPTNNMYAYNNARVRLIQGQTNANGTNWLSNYRMIRNDYTRVGIVPSVIKLEKVWKDQNNHDGLRPEAVTVAVERRVAGLAGDFQPVMDSKNQPVTAVMDQTNNWSAQFNQLDIVNENGQRYLYTFTEVPVEGYESKVEFIDLNHYRLINVHPNEQIPVSGEKVWNDDDNANGMRPQSVTLKLYRDDEYVTSRVVTPDADGKWTYSFGKLDKYAEGGHEYVYRVEEEYVPKYAGESIDYTMVNNTYHPMGNLEVLKTVENATATAAKLQFTFTLVLLQEQTDPTQPAVPLMDKYAYIVYEQNGDEWKQVAEGKIGNGDPFHLMGNQKIVVYDLPSESAYEVFETEAAGFTVTSQDAEGTIRAGQTARAEFTNTYSAKGVTQLTVDKSLGGRQIRKNQFRFELVDNNPDSPTYGEVIRTARVNAPEEGNTTGGSGKDIESAAEAIFGQLDYTEADAGSTFQYIVREVNMGANGYGYDAKEYAVTIAVTDDTGDGNLTVTPTFATANGTADSLAFDNTYTAEGEVVLKAWKVLEGRPLKEKEFTFELYAFDNATGDITGDCLGTATNDAEGNIVFGALKFDQNDVSLNDDEPATYTYLIREKQGRDNTVVYSNQEYVITLRVFDNGDGTLSFSQDSQGYEREIVDCSSCKGSGVGYLCVTYLSKNGSTSTRKVNYGRNGFCDACGGFRKDANGEKCSKCGGCGLSESFASGGYYVEIRSWSGQTFMTVYSAYSYGDAYGGGNHYYATIKDDDDIRKCTYCDGVGTVPGKMTITGDLTMPVFENTLKPGSLSLTKRVQGTGSSNPGQEFTFHVKLSGEAAPDIDYDFSGPEVTPALAVPPTPTPNLTIGESSGLITPAPTVQPTVKPTKQPVVIPTVQPVVMDHAEPVVQAPTQAYTASNLNGEGLAILNETTGEMVFFRANANTDGSYTYNGAASDNTNVTFTFGETNSASTTVDGTVYHVFRNFENIAASYNAWPWYANKDSIVSVSMEGDIKLKTLQWMFVNQSKLEQVTLDKLDTSGVTNMAYMFQNCSALVSANLNGLNTSAVTDMSYLFKDCDHLTSIDISSFDTQNAKQMQYMFYNCYDIQSLNLKHFNTAKVTDMTAMFGNCQELTSLDLSSFNTSNVTTMSQLFYYCKALRSINLSSFDTSSVKYMSQMFYSTKLTNLDLRHFNTSNVVNMSEMFSACSKLTQLQISSFDTSNVKYMNEMFKGCYELPAVDLSNFSTGIVEDMNRMFEDCYVLQELDLSNFDTSNVTAMGGMFADCKALKSLNLSSFDTSKVTSINWNDVGLFENCMALEKLDLSNFTTQNITNMKRMFSGCSSLKELDLTNFDTSNVTSMQSMFNGCSSLESIDLSSFNTSLVTSMDHMFNNCSGLTELDLGTFDTSRVNDMQYMFAKCSTLPEIDVSTFNTSNVTNMDYMFGGCSNLESLNVRNFDTSKNKRWSNMFRECTKLKELDLSSFTRNGSSPWFWYMFYGCTALEKLDISSLNTRWPKTSDKMYTNVRNLSWIKIGNDYAELDSYIYPPSTAPYDGKWVNAEDPEQVLTLSELFRDGGHAGVWVWHKISYKLNFDHGDGAGEMKSQWVECGTEYSFVPTFYFFGHELVGFTDGTNTYPVEEGICIIPQGNTYGENQEVTLTALWQPRQSAVTATEDGYTVNLKVNETITFDNIPASTAYEVWEETPAGWVLVNKVNENGVILPLETSEVQFTNEYNPNKTSVTLRASKLMDGTGAEANAFTFTLSENGSVLQTKQNAAGGSIIFDMIEYGKDDVGTHTYTIAEVTGKDGTINYDKASYTVTVTVADDAQGNLSAVVKYPDDQPPVFVNSTKPGALTVSKTTKGATDAAAGQTFTVQVLFTDAMGRPFAGEVTANGSAYSITDGYLTAKMGNGGVLNITNIPAGVHYQVSEPDSLPGWTMDSTKSGVIQSTKTSKENLLNTYVVKGVAAPRINKVLNGRTLTEDEFTFQLVDVNNSVVSVATNAADGSVIFPDIPYTSEGDYLYAVVEVPGNDETVSYCNDVVFVAINMADKDGKGLLTPTITYTLHDVSDEVNVDGENTITNKVKPGSLSVSKTVVSSNPAHDTQEFYFTLLLTDAAGQPLSGQYFIEKSGNTEYLTVTDGSAVFTLTGGETALISGLPHGANYAVTEADAAGFIQKSLGATGNIVVNQTASASFTNTYAATGEYSPVAQKSLSGKPLQADEFVFALLDEEGYELMSARNDENGNISFPALTFCETDVGTKVYQIVEVDSGAAGVTYDTVIQTITLNITDNRDGTLLITDDLNGQPVLFTNTYSDTTSHSISKNWLDDEDALGIRPDSITVELYQNKVKYSEASLTAESGWTYTFTNLPAFDAQGMKYTYEARELPVPGYSSSVNTQGNATTLTNSPLGVMEITKTVTEGNLQKAFPFTVTLSQGDQPVTGSFPAVGPDGALMATFGEDGAFHFKLKHGETMRIYELPIGVNYAVAETTGDGYVGELTEGSAEGIILRNELIRVGFTNAAKTTSFTVKKIWEGGSGAITLTLYANGKKMDPQPKYTRDGDVYTYENLRMYDDDGFTIEYSAKEKYFEGFVTIYENVSPHENTTNVVYNGGTIINRKVRQAEFQVYKRWRGLKENETPPAITLVLYCNGEKLDIKTPTPSNGWYKYYDLPDQYKGEPAVYTVMEEPLPGYEAAYQNAIGRKADCADNGGTIINTKLPDTGDRQPIAMWLTLAGVSLLIMILLVHKKRKLP
ncbi:MAG: BspA family leucine-rich repeat surface protein [Clostridia bacterium]|nr:BspA family leucine-rich repeat surface protein [Clostridia bacterium]